TYLVSRNARDFYLILPEFCCNLFYCQAAFTKVQQFGRERTELANFRRPRRSSANYEFHLPDGYVMQRASLLEPPNNLLIISRNLDNLYSRKQLGTADGRDQIFN